MTKGLIFFLFLYSLNKKQTSPLGSYINKVKLILKKASFQFTRAVLTFHERIHQMPPCGWKIPLPAGVWSKVSTARWHCRVPALQGRTVCSGGDPVPWLGGCPGPIAGGTCMWECMMPLPWRLEVFLPWENVSGYHPVIFNRDWTWMWGCLCVIIHNL